MSLDQNLYREKAARVRIEADTETLLTSDVFGTLGRNSLRSKHKCLRRRGRGRRKIENNGSNSNAISTVRVTTHIA
jgi:hypothetical protein